jgi:hypothetical protein
MKRAKDATLVVCLFVLYCVMLSQGLKASAASAFFGALAAVPLTVHLYHRLWPSPPENGGRGRGSHPRIRRDADEAEPEFAPGRVDGRGGQTD